MEYVPELTGLRALAIFFCVSEHVNMPLGSGGWIGVDIFFVLSGYLITTVLLEEHRSSGTVRLRRFYMRRVLRLYPGLAALFLVCLTCARYLGDGGTLLGYGRTALLGLTYTEDFALGLTGNAPGNLGHTWSLAVEEQFYLLWAPVLVVLLKRRWSPLPTLLAAVAASSLSLVLTTRNGGLPDTYYRPDTRMNELFLGCLLAVLLPRIEGRLRPTAFARHALGPLGLVGILATVLYSDWHTRATSYPQQELIAAASSVCLVAGLLVGGRRAPLNVVLRLGPVEWLGTISYSIYLYFIPVTVMFDTLWPAGSVPPGELMARQLITMVVLGAVSHYVVERPFLKLKGRFSSVRPAPSAAGAPVGVPTGSRAGGAGVGFSERRGLVPRTRLRRPPGSPLPLPALSGLVVPSAAASGLGATGPLLLGPRSAAQRLPAVERLPLGGGPAADGNLGAR